jgi:hypothetical protein
MAGTGGFGSPNNASLITDPSTVNTPGLQQEINNVYTQAGQRQGKANDSARAALQASGIGSGDEVSNALGNIAGQTALGESQGLAGLQNQQFLQQSQLMNALNNAQLEQYASQGMNNLGFNAQRNQMIQGMGGAAGGLGSVLGQNIGQTGYPSSTQTPPLQAANGQNGAPSLGNVAQMMGTLGPLIAMM